MDLVIELRERNEKALCLLIDIYGGLIKSIIRKHVKQPEACDEADYKTTVGQTVSDSGVDVPSI